MASGAGAWRHSDISEEQQGAAWEYIKWVTSAEVQKQMSELGGGGYMRISTVADPDLLELYPFLPVLHESFMNGEGEFRPRTPEYPEIQDILGSAVNAVLVGDADPQAALDDAQEEAMELF